MSGQDFLKSGSLDRIVVHWTELRFCPLLHLSRPGMPVINARFVPEAEVISVIQGD
ncbi:MULTISPECIES: hypothetical protein [Enterobacteriaceae]|uniref:hypothetical protein n=1 Tax=Enterobacteriaceae TaxID=543 RepID=UPI001652DF79|nr:MULTISPECIES: hypothetical protein [Enterobacteriaceae]EIZ7163585.1 hypothetical protein [Salmonella enterica subsp. enterica serovar Senftenberg]HBV5159253.1 hypothetical protein [Klebsiella oxytoca]HCF8274059.1 hypothetical protein [Klebsiella pneumoniae]EFH4334439.1 hypothetical protein [Escherichia coli]EFH4623932.1 hypothetical protein [Escherichia coli]